ncbi:MAG: 50S ribosomal protein L22 [Candidatus Nomurabacteria bacterium]|nr:50S ribosomal protein L22 [Candidatus Nomurabacteria bacterium]
MKAFLKNYRQSPRKVRLVADLIKGKRVSEAFTQLKNLPKRAALPIEKLLASAVANAKVSGIVTEDLYVANVTVNEGIVMKRSMPRARGSASRINKRTSHIMLTLIEKNAEKKVKKAEKAEKAPTEKKVVAKKSKVVKKVEVKA